MTFDRFKHVSLFLGMLTTTLLPLSAPQARAEGGLSAERVSFWGVLANDPRLTGDQWIPLALYPNPRMAAEAVAILQRNGLTGRSVEGFASPAELQRHGRTAEQGRLQLQRLVSRQQLAAMQREFAEADRIEASQRQTIEQGGFSPERRDVINGAGFDPGRRNVINGAGFDPRRRNIINGAGFDPGRRQQINAGRYPFGQPGMASPPSNPRGNFGTQGQTTNRNRGSFGTQSPSSNTRRGNFGTQ